MTLEEAVAVLNREKHRGYEDWERTVFSQSAIGGMVGTNGFTVDLDPFEAIAIAEKYEREKAVSRDCKAEIRVGLPTIDTRPFEALLSVMDRACANAIFNKPDEVIDYLPDAA